MRRNRNSSAKNSISVNFEGVNSTTRMEDGEYAATIKDVVHEKSQNSGNPMLTFTLDVDGNDMKYWCPLEGQSLWKLRDLLECAGVEVPDGPLDIDLDELKGLELGVVVENEKYQGKERPKVIATIPAGEEEPEQEPEDKKPARGAKASAKKEEAKEETGGRRRRTPAKEEPEEPEFKKGDKVSFDEDGKTLKGTIVGPDEEAEGCFVVKVGKEEWSIPGDELTAI